MSVYGPLRVILFFYELIRLLLLAAFLFAAPIENTMYGDFFPYLVYLSANALFPLMALFIWLRPNEYKNYVTLYMAGKIIGTVSFIAWEIFGSRRFTGMEDLVTGLFLLGGSIFLSIADTLSVWGAWKLKIRYNRIERAEV